MSSSSKPYSWFLNNPWSVQRGITPPQNPFPSIFESKPPRPWGHYQFDDNERKQLIERAKRDSHMMSQNSSFEQQSYQKGTEEDILKAMDVLLK